MADGLRLAASALAAADIVGALDVAVVTVVAGATGFGALGRDEVGVSERTGAIAVATGARRVRVTATRATDRRATDRRATLVEATAWLRGVAAAGVEVRWETEVTWAIEVTCARRGVWVSGRVGRRGADRLVSVGPVASAFDAPALSVAREPVAPDASETA